MPEAPVAEAEGGVPPSKVHANAALSKLLAAISVDFVNFHVTLSPKFTVLSDGAQVPPPVDGITIEELEDGGKIGPTEKDDAGAITELDDLTLISKDEMPG